MTNVDKNELASAQVEYLKQKAWDDFFVFAKYVCGFDLMQKKPHREVCDFLMLGLDTNDYLDIDFDPPKSVKYNKNKNRWRGAMQKLLELPRNTFKSTTTTTAFPLWLLWHNPNLRIMIDSETLANAKMYLSGIKNLIQNAPMVKMVCRNDDGEYIFEPANEAGGWTQDQIILASRTNVGQKEPTIFCSGVDNAKTGTHPDIIIMDDLVSERNVTTDEQINKVKDHYKFSLSLLELSGLQIVVGTRYHFADLYGDLENSQNFDKMIRPAVTPEGDYFFPSRLSAEYLKKQKEEQGSYIYSCQYMLSPIDDENAVFKQDDINYYNKAPNFMEKYITVDPAIGQEQHHDNTAILVTGVDHKRDLYVIEYTRDKLTPKEIIDKIFHYADKHRGRLRTIGIEGVAYQKTLLYTMKDEMIRQNKHYKVTELKAIKSKDQRIMGLVPWLETGRFYMKNTHVELEEELVNYPYAKKRDTVDALAYVLQLLKPRGQRRRFREEPKTYRNSVTGY